MMNEHCTITLSHGHTMGYAEYGTPDGFPVIAFHGMPTTRLVWKVAHEAAIECGIRLIAPDRPGYALSHDQPVRALLDYPDDITRFADQLGLSRFAIMGASGGGPACLACAYALPERVTSATLVSAIGSLLFPDAMKGMQQINRTMFTLGKLSSSFASVALIQMIRMSLPSMNKYYQTHTSPSADISPEVYAILCEDSAEVARNSRKGIAFDLKMFWQDFGFRLEDIHTPVFLWHGDSDDLAPTGAARAMAVKLPNCKAHYFPGEGHIGPLTKHMPEILKNVIGISV